MSPLDQLDALPDMVGHIPDPIADYLEWVLVGCGDGSARLELVRVLDEVTR